MYRCHYKLLLLCISIVFLMLSPVSALEIYKTSSYGAGVQIWFEVEDFDERDPDDDSRFALSDEPGAFGRSINSYDVGGDGSGMIRYTFDISKAGGSGGTWYFWGRVINPSNQSDFMVVPGHPGDPDTISLPQSGLGNSQRVFEENIGSAGNWAWGRTNHGEGHTKTLQDGENSMYILNRQSGAIWDVFMWTDDPDYVPTDADYENAKPASKAQASNPSLTGTDVPYYINTLSWAAGEFAVAHDVYLGTVFEDVNEASRNDDRGVLVSPGQAETSYTHPELLTLGKTYYWRIDEVNAPSQPATYKGETWSFTMEPVAYALGSGSVTATASGQLNEANGPEKATDGSGLVDGLHDANDKNMWLAPTGLPAWIQFDFDRVYLLNDMKVWNQNQLLEAILGLGAKDVVIETSEDGEIFTALGDPMLIDQAPGIDGAPASSIIDMSGVMAKAVKITINTSYGFLMQAGLAEVQFSYIPAYPREFDPANGADIDGLEIPLSWRAGRFADEHQVVFSSDLAAVQDGSAVVTTTSAKNHTVTGLDYGATYFWKIVDVAADGATYAGPMNILFTPLIGVIDDMEMYKDEAFLEIWAFWVDGYQDETNGSTVGNGSAPETVEVYEGAQSMPMAYDNSSAPKSEATRTFDPPLDLTAGNADNIGVYFKGVPYEFNGYYSQDGPDFWTAMALNPLSVAMGDDATIGLALTSHDRAAVATGTFSEIQTSGDMSGDWTVVAIGSDAAGHPADIGGITGSTATLMAGGNDIWNTADEFVYAYRQLSGEGAIQAKVDTLDAPDNWTKAGVMIRNSADASASYASVQVTGVNGTRFQYRDADGVSAESDTSVLDGTQELLSEPAWIKVERLSVNDAAEVYLTVTDSSNNSVTIPHPDPAATRIGAWTLLSVPLSEFAGVNLSSVKSIAVGVRGAGAVGRIYVDYLHLEEELTVDNPVDIWLEAEAADTLGVSWRLVDDPNASGGQRIGSEDDDGNDNGSPPDPNWMAAYDFSVPETGVYNVVFRGQEAGSDSFWVRILGSAAQNVESPVGNGWARFNGFDAPSGYAWDKVHSDQHGNTVVKWVLPAGPLTLEVGKREDGVYLDAILITNELGTDQATLPDAIPVP